MLERFDCTDGKPVVRSSYHMIKKSTEEKETGAVELAKQAAVSAKKFLMADTPTVTATKTILALAALAPIAVTGAMAPNVFQILKPYATRRPFSVRKTSYTLNLLNRSKYLSITHYPDGHTEIRITKKGMRRVRKLCLETIRLSSEPVWNERWHLFFYDIPIHLNAARLALRDMAEELGMFPLQKSLWAYPYACEAEMLFVARFFGVDRYINFAVADSLLDEDVLLKFFRLKKSVH